VVVSSQAPSTSVGQCTTSATRLTPIADAHSPAAIGIAETTTMPIRIHSTAPWSFGT
jgi:hypothetical protein